MTNQEYINQAVAAGIPLSAINGFLSGNPGDYSRILSALGPDYIQGSGASVTTISPGGNAYTVPTPYATPTPVSGNAGSLTQSSASDAMITGHGDLGFVGGIPGAPTVFTTRDAGNLAPTSQLAIMPAPRIPPLAILAAFAVLAFLFLRK